MNFLAHAYLSFNDPDILIGNLIADQVKGKQIDQYPEAIKRGIDIHRQIDAFTDSHPVNIASKDVFNSSVGRYSASFLDVAYDHFLALDQNHEPEGGWRNFANECYHQVELYANILPPHFCSMFLYMKGEDWLYNYRYSWLIQRSFERLARRASFLDNDVHVYDDFELHYEAIADSYNAFFPDLKMFVKKEFFTHTI